MMSYAALQPTATALKGSNLANYDAEQNHKLMINDFNLKLKLILLLGRREASAVKMDSTSFFFFKNQNGRSKQ